MENNFHIAIKKLQHTDYNIVGMFKVQKNKLKVTKGQVKFFKELTHKSKNLYNATLYETRQHFFKCGQFLTYNSAYHIMKERGEYSELPLP